MDRPVTAVTNLHSSHDHELSYAQTLGVNKPRWGLTFGAGSIALMALIMWGIMSPPTIAHTPTVSESKSELAEDIARDPAYGVIGAFRVSISATATPTVTQPIITPTVASTPDPVRLRAGTIAVPAGVTTTTVPIDVIVLTDRINIGVFSANIQYDPTLLKAMGCAQGAPLDLLLCNVATPGVVQLAGVSALGIRGETTAANLAFELLQNAQLSTPLTVNIKFMGDGAGATVGATPLDGSIALSCLAGTEFCQRGNMIYLPLVQR